MSLGSAGSAGSEPLSEFQRFIATTTGQVLSVYGTNLFDRAPTTFAPLEMTPIPPDYTVGPGDELRIRVWGQVNFQFNLRVDRSGEIFLPQVGPVHVAGLPFSALEGQLRTAIDRIYHNYNLTIDLGQTRAIQIYVTGQVHRPGLYTISALSSFVDAVFVSGGASMQGSLRNVQLRRGNLLVSSFDLYDLMARGDKSKDVRLQSGDVLFIPTVGPQVAITGSVRAPAIYEIKPGETIASLLADAGGVNSVASNTRISMERIDAHRDRSAMEIRFDEKGLATPLVDGDLIRIDSIVPLYRNTVTLRGNTANPGRFAWHKGMHLADLIPDQESLLTRDYWWRRAQLGLPAPEFEPVSGFTGYRQPSSDQVQMLAQPGFTDQNDVSGQQRYAGQRGGGAPLAEASAVGMSGSQQRTAVRNLAPAVNWDYAVIERLNPETLQTVLVPFDLGRLVRDHDSSQNLELLAGDVVTVFSAADLRLPIAHQSKIVTLEGEFAHPGTYTAQPDETLRQLVARVGGLSPNAYLYGSSFTRKSTRAVQQARINEYVESLTMKLQRASMELGATQGGRTEATANVAAAQQSAQQLIASLRQIQASGQIVLEMEASSTGVDSLPDIPLEDGDRLLVPSTPANINVVGAVYNQSSFIYSNGRKVNDYLRQAGGATRDADKAHLFIIRANGSVVSRDQNEGLFEADFGRLNLYPGDSLVMPEKTFRASSIRALIEWSQTFAQLGIGVATISLLR